MGVMCQSCGTELATWTGKCPQCGGTQQLSLRPKGDPMIDKVIGGRYRITKKLGQGGMGSVYLAEHTGVGQRVAIKFLNPSLSGDPDVVRRFLNEARSYGQITHPHAVQLHDFGQDDEGSLFISMEFIEGRDLKRVLQEEGGRLSVKDVLDIVLQVADVLGYAHDKGIVHRDLKPENIMMVKGLRGWHAKVLDFGIARLTGEQGTRLTAAGSICGTPRYMSPEQAEGNDVDHRSDIYSLGLVLFELTTGLHPFAAGSIAETLRRQVMEPMPHISDVNAALKVPDGLDAVIQKAVAKDRELRWKSMGEFAEALVALVPTTTVDAFAPPPVKSEAINAETVIKPKAPAEKTSHTSSPYDRTSGKPAASRGARTKLLAGGAAAVLLVAVAGAWFAFGGRKQAPAAGWEELDRAQAAADAGAGVAAAPQQPDLPAQPAAVASPSAEPVQPAVAAQPAGQDSSAVRLMAETAMLAQANNEFVAGRLQTASQMLQSIPADSPVRDQVADLDRRIGELNALMSKADGLYRRGSCPEAIAVYEQVRRRNPGIGAAAQGISRCRREMPTGTLE